ncbi:MAG: TRAP transporter substrate-binding protein DctP [Ilumatobacteraceae bacterium]
MMLVAATTVVAAVASCADAPAKTGGKIAPVTLRTTVTGEMNTPGRDLLEMIRTTANTLSNGAVDLAGGDFAAGVHGDDQDGAAIQRVRDGSADFAVVRAAAFTAAGDLRLAALQAPFLIDNEELAVRVAADPIANEMLATLTQIGLVGLAIVPSGLRHPIGWNKPLVTLSDYRGAIINTRPGIDIDRVFAALGATTDHSVGDERLVAARNGTLRGIELSLLQIPAPVGGAPATMTSNVVLYSKFDVVIVNKKFFDAMNGGQRDALREAVRDAVVATLAGRPSESEAHQAWCDGAGASVLATPSDLADLQAATASVVTDLERNDFTQGAIQRIRELATGTHPVSYTTCAGPTSTPTRLVAVGDQSVLDGTWRWETTRQNLLDAGVPPNEVAKDVGINTFILHGGELSGHTPTGLCYGTYKINGSRFAWAWVADGLCGGDFEGAFIRDGDKVTFAFGPDDENGRFYDGFFKGGLVRIGGAP